MHRNRLPATKPKAQSCAAFATEQVINNEYLAKPDFQALFEQTPSLYMVLDPQFRVVAASDAYLKATLTHREDIIGRHVFEVFPDNPDDPSADAAVPKARASFNRVLQTRKPDVQGFQRHDVRRPDSEGGGFEVRYWSAVNSPVLNPDGSLAYILHRVENVTEFVLLKQQGIEQSRLTEELREQAVLMEADLYSRSREVAESSRKLKEANAEIARHQERIEELIKERSDELETANAKLRMGISERKQAEDALRVSEARFRALVEASSDVLYRMSPDWNEMRHLRGGGFLANTEAPTRNWLQEYIPPDDQPHVMEVIKEAILKKSIFELEHRILRADGTLGWTFSRAVPMLKQNGEIVEWFGAASDITRRKQAEEALRQSERRYKSLSAYLELRIRERTAELERKTGSFRSLPSSPHTT